LPHNADSSVITSDNFFYKPEDWKMHRPVDFKTGEFFQKITPFMDQMVVEYIIKSDNTFGIERRFAKLSDGQWNLIYYVAPNRFNIQKTEK
jgi:hypothetical protein